MPPYVRDTQPTLSLAITAGGPPERIHALLTLMRPYVDEIVLAVDRGRGVAALGRARSLRTAASRSRLATRPPA